MQLFFEREEYVRRLNGVKASMAESALDVMLVSDANNICWLTGAADWSFYTPQFVVVAAEFPEPVWIGRAMDRSGAVLTSWMSEENIRSYPEHLVQTPSTHPSLNIGEQIAEMGLADARIGYESDSYYFSPKSFAHLQRALPDATFVDAELLVNRARVVKSDAEVQKIREAARLVESAMNVAYGMIEPGVRQCDVIGEIYKAQLGGGLEFGGDITALCPIILAGEKASTAHPAWTDEKFTKGQTVALELAGSRHRYTTGLARTMHLGQAPSTQLTDTAKAVEEGLEAVLAMLKAGVTGADVHHAWQQVLSKYGLKKDSRIGYSIGVGLPPDWGEHVISLRSGENAPIEANTALHIILGMWMDGWGMEMSETVVVTRNGYESMTHFPRQLHLK
jgi:Xaa-Pro aminopeptidase